MNCDCPDFCDDLVDLSKEILAKGDGVPQWNVLELFLTKYKGDDPHTSDENSSDEGSMPPCSVNICPLFARNLNEFRRSGTALSTLLVDFMAIFHFDDCASDNAHWLCDTERTRSFSRELESIRVIGAFRWKINNGFMKLLLNFGLLPSLPGDSPHIIDELEIELYSFMMHTSDNLSNTELQPLRKEAMRLVTSIFFRQDNIDNQKRMYFAVIAIDAIRLSVTYSNAYAEQYIKSLRMYFTGTHDAFLTVFEVRSVLYACFLLLNKLHLFDIYCKGFEKLMPECPAKTEPRKLTHLTRCKIREILNVSNRPLPSAIDKLFSSKLLLPMNLKSFILGEELDISRERSNISSQTSITQSELALLMSERSES